VDSFKRELSQDPVFAELAKPKEVDFFGGCNSQVSFRRNNANDYDEDGLVENLDIYTYGEYNRSVRSENKINEEVIEVCDNKSVDLIEDSEEVEEEREVQIHVRSNNDNDVLPIRETHPHVTYVPLRGGMRSGKRNEVVITRNSKPFRQSHKRVSLCSQSIPANSYVVEYFQTNSIIPTTGDDGLRPYGYTRQAMRYRNYKVLNTTLNITTMWPVDGVFISTLPVTRHFSDGLSYAHIRSLPLLVTRPVDERHREIIRDISAWSHIYGSEADYMRVPSLSSFEAAREFGGVAVIIYNGNDFPLRFKYIVERDFHVEWSREGVNVVSSDCRRAIVLEPPYEYHLLHDDILEKVVRQPQWTRGSYIYNKNVEDHNNVFQDENPGQTDGDFIREVSSELGIDIENNYDPD